MGADFPILAAGRCFAQPTPAPPEFEAASLKPSKSASHEVRTGGSPACFRVRVPIWLDSEPGILDPEL